MRCLKEGENDFKSEEGGEIIRLGDRNEVKKWKE